MPSETPPRHVVTCDCRACERHGCGIFGPQPGGAPAVVVTPAPKRIRKQLRRALVAQLLALRAEPAADTAERKRTA